jgi:hypothetical protein
MAYEIKIKEDECRALLHRDKVIADVKRAFPEQVALLRELTNYGSNLIPRCYISSEKELKDLVVLAILLRQVVAMLDSIEILASNGAVYAAGLQSRALFEASVYIEWILKTDAQKKATYYYVHNVRRQRMWARRSQPGSKEAIAFAASSSDLLSLLSAKTVQEAKNKLPEIDRLLSQPTFRAVNEAFDERATKNGQDVQWYVPLGMQSIKAIMKNVGKLTEYLVFYAIFSNAMHSSDYFAHIKIGEGRVAFEPVRHLKGYEPLFRFSASTAINTYRRILEEYRHGELDGFNRKYMENWRKAFMEVPPIEYKITSTNL